MDRPMILQALHQLSSRLPDRRILTWEFFFNRFDALYLEAQIALEKYGDIAFPRGEMKTTGRFCVVSKGRKGIGTRLDIKSDKFLEQHD